MNGLDLAQQVSCDTAYIFNPNTKFTIEPEKFKSRSKNSPYKGWQVRGKVLHTLVAGRSVYSDHNE